MGKEKYLAWGLLVLFTLNIASALPYRQNNPLDIKHAVRLDGFYTSSALCNMTAYNPVWNAIIENKALTYNSTLQAYNLTIPSTKVNLTGTYCYDITCSVSGINSTQQFCVEVNPDGKDYTTAESITYIFVLLLTVSIFFFFIWGAMKIDTTPRINEYNELVKVNWNRHIRNLLIVTCYLMFVFITYITWNISFAYLDLPSVGNFFVFLHRYSFALMWPFLAVYIILTFVLFIHDKKLQGLIDKGIRVNA